MLVRIFLGSALATCGCAKLEPPLAGKAVVHEAEAEAEADVVDVDVELGESKEAGKQIDSASQPSSHGEKLFSAYCAACHQLGGQGVEGRVPPLDNSPWVTGSEDRLIRIVLNGLRGPIEIHGEIYNLEMPAFRMLFQDDDIAAMLAYVRQRYGSPSPVVTPETVARVRRETEDRSSYWTVEELLRIP